MMTSIFVVCYAFLAFFTAAVLYGLYYKMEEVFDTDVKIATFFWALFWPLLWIVFFIKIVCFLIGHGVKIVGLKISKFL